MPKRIKTPPPPDDEPRYLTVVHPYPLNANLELPADQRTLALWLACCTGKDVLLAMFHKPASPGMVVIEVDRDFDGFDALLGLHAWEKFLLQPTKEQKDKSSRVFYCTYGTGRQVEKSGWKRVNIKEHWFHGWTANNAIIKHPYPKSTYCDVPSEAITGAPMCRPLPKKSFPVPPPPPTPVVGSPEWLAARNANVSASPAPSSANKSRKGARPAPSDTASVLSTSVVSTSSKSTKKSFSPSPAPSPAPSSVMANYRAKNDVAWKRGPPSVSSVASAATSRAPSTAGSASARSSRAGGASPAPPGLGPRPSSQSSQSRAPRRFDWSEDVEQFEFEQANNPARSTSALSVSINSSWRQPPDPDGPIEPPKAYDYNEEDRPRHSTAAAMEDIFEDDDDYGPPVAAPPSRHRAGGTRPPGIDDPDYDPWNPPEEAAPSVSDWSEAGDDPAANPWDGYDAPRPEEQTKVKKQGTWICPQHGPLCNPGICKARAHHEYEVRMEKNRIKWAQEKLDRDAARERALRKKEKRRADAERSGSESSSSSSSSRKSGSGSDDTSRDQGPGAPPQPDQEEWPIAWNAGRADSESVVSSARRPWESVAGSNDDGDDDDFDEGASVAKSHTTNTTHTTSAASLSSMPRPESVNTWRKKLPQPRNAAGAIRFVPAISPEPQSSWDSRSVTSQAPSTRPSLSAPSRQSSVSAPSVIGSETGQRSRTGTRQSSTSDARSVTSSSARTDGPTTPSMSSIANGFPTQADMDWADPIAVAMEKERNRKKSGDDDDDDADADDAESGSRKKASKSARKRRNKVKTAQAQTLAQVQAAQANTVEAGIGVELPPGGPGSSWGDPNEVW